MSVRIPLCDTTSHGWTSGIILLPAESMFGRRKHALGRAIMGAAFRPLALTLLALRLFAADTAMFRGDPAHSGVYDSAAAPALSTVKWKFKTSGKVLSSPAVAAPFTSAAPTTISMPWPPPMAPSAGNSEVRPPSTLRPPPPTAWSISPASTAISTPSKRRPERSNGNSRPKASAASPLPESTAPRRVPSSCPIPSTSSSLLPCSRAGWSTSAAATTTSTPWTPLPATSNGDSPPATWSTPRLR